MKSVLLSTAIAAASIFAVATPAVAQNNVQAVPCWGEYLMQDKYDYDTGETNSVPSLWVYVQPDFAWLNETFNLGPDAFGHRVNVDVVLENNAQGQDYIELRSDENGQVRMQYDDMYFALNTEGYEAAIPVKACYFTF